MKVAKDIIFISSSAFLHFLIFKTISIFICNKDNRFEIILIDNFAGWKMYESGPSREKESIDLFIYLSIIRNNIYNVYIVKNWLIQRLRSPHICSQQAEAPEEPTVCSSPSLSPKAAR